MSWQYGCAKQHSPVSRLLGAIAAPLRLASLLAVVSGTLRLSAAGAEQPAAFDLVYEHTIRGNQDLYVLEAGATVPRRLTREPSTDALPRWSRDGSEVFFTSDRAGNWQVFSVPAEGGAARRMRSNAHREWQVDPAPGGTRIAFLSNAEGPEHLFVLDLATAAERVLVRHGRRTAFGNPHWSTDGRRIVFSTNWPKGHGIHVVDAATGEERPVDATLKGACEPRFHPGGRRIVYVSRGGHAETSRLVEHDLQTGAKKVLVDWRALNYNPVYAPDGREIAFTSNITGEWVVYRQRLSDGRSWRVTRAAGPARAPDYRPRKGRRP